MAREKTTIFRGVVTEIENLDECLSFVTLNPIEEHIESLRLPLYLALSEDYIGRYVDVKIVERGRLFKKTIEQEISSSNMTASVKLKKSQANYLLKVL